MARISYGFPSQNNEIKMYVADADVWRVRPYVKGIANGINHHVILGAPLVPGEVRPFPYSDLGTSAPFDVVANY
jgi:hypothetical protein